MAKKAEEPVLKRYIITNTTSWQDSIKAERIEKDPYGNTLCFIGKELVGSFPRELAVGIVEEPGKETETLASL